MLYGDGNDAGGISGGDDTLDGGSGDDVLYGDNYPTEPFAGAGHSGIGGDDILIGGTGSDQLWGNGGNDTFVFNVDDGADVIHDFTQEVEPGAEQDKIDLSAYGFASFDDITIATNAFTGWAVIQLSATDSIFVVGLQPDQLTANDFIL
jgi:Ca2+-binding RTX toxin-like protein